MLLPLQEQRLAAVENTQIQLSEALQRLQLPPGTMESSRSQPQALKAPCANGNAP